MSFTPEEIKELNRICKMNISQFDKNKLQGPIFDKITTRLNQEKKLSDATYKLRQSLDEAVEAGLSKEDITQLYDEVLVQHVMEK